MTGTARLAALPILATVAFAGCGTDGGRQRVSVLEAQPKDGGQTISIWVGSCEGEPTAVVTGNTERIIIDVEAFVPTGDSNTECADGLVIQLAEPLGDRQVIDGRTGDEVRVEVP
ncbi:MAG: hypothetical protein AAF962_26310 [Actinomycetota bacterium]